MTKGAIVCIYYFFKGDLTRVAAINYFKYACTNITKTSNKTYSISFQLRDSNNIHTNFERPKTKCKQVNVSQGKKAAFI